MLGDKFLRDELNKFAKYVIQQSRSNLTKGKSPYGSFNDTKKLSKFVDINKIWDFIGEGCNCD